ncbi:hypothetical protein EDD17DRAFT_1563982 [Pisolithus thermaeus]|nr:hypothetical protein EDD17DRAFT_1563982 [Pisolithus thermaeus]
MGRPDNVPVNSSLLVRPLSRLNGRVVVLLVAAALLWLTESIISRWGFDRAGNPWVGLAKHCKHTRPIPESEFIERQHMLAHALYASKASAYVAEPGTNAQFFGNICGSS